MADRLSQYAMGPPNFNSAMLQQQQLSQQQQQSQVDPQPTNVFSSAEHRVWQMQQQLQNSYPQSAGDMQSTQRVSFSS
jgi:CHAD domain-containing protein